MLFFKQIADTEFKDPSFKELYDSECHICFGTMKLIEAVEKDPSLLAEIIDACGMTQSSYADLKNGDYCDPRIVRKLYAVLGLPEPETFKACPRLKLHDPE